MTKLKAAQTEKKDLFQEFQAEKEAMHETIRDLDRQLKYSELLIENFIPPEWFQKIREMSKWEDIQNEWVIDYQEYAGNHVNGDGEQKSGLAEQIGVQVDPQYDYYDPYAMGPEMAEEQQFASVGPEMAAIVQGQGVKQAFLSYNGGPEEDDEDPQQPKQSRPKSGATTGKRSSGSARPKSVRPGSARNKKKSKESDVHSGIPDHQDEPEKSVANVPKARGLVSKRPPSARVRQQK